MKLLSSILKKIKNSHYSVPVFPWWEAECIIRNCILTATKPIFSYSFSALESRIIFLGSIMNFLPLFITSCFYITVFVIDFCTENVININEHLRCFYSLWNILNYSNCGLKLRPSIMDSFTSETKMESHHQLSRRQLIHLS